MKSYVRVKVSCVCFYFFIYFSLVCLPRHSELKLKNLLCSANGGERRLPFIFIFICFAVPVEEKEGLGSWTMGPRGLNSIMDYECFLTRKQVEKVITEDGIRSVIRKGIETQISLCSTGKMQSPLSYLYQSLKCIQVWQIS